MQVVISRAIYELRLNQKATVTVNQSIHNFRQVSSKQFTVIYIMQHVS